MPEIRVLQTMPKITNTLYHGLLEFVILGWTCYWPISIILSWLSYPELSAGFTVCELNNQTA